MKWMQLIWCLRSVTGILTHENHTGKTSTVLSSGVCSDPVSGGDCEDEICCVLGGPIDSPPEERYRSPSRVCESVERALVETTTTTTIVMNS